MDEIDLTNLNDRYAEAIIGDNKADYDALEVHGVRNHNKPGDPKGTFCEVDNENPEFFSTYVHLKAGGLECVGDFGHEATAVSYATELSATYGWSFMGNVGNVGNTPVM